MFEAFIFINCEVGQFYLLFIESILIVWHIVFQERINQSSTIASCAQRNPCSSGTRPHSFSTWKKITQPSSPGNARSVHSLVSCPIACHFLKFRWIHLRSILEIFWSVIYNFSFVKFNHVISTYIVQPEMEYDKILSVDVIMSAWSCCGPMGLDCRSLIAWISLCCSWYWGFCV